VYDDITRSITKNVSFVNIVFIVNFVDTVHIPTQTIQGERACMQEPTEHLKPYHHGDLRNALIQAGLELLAQEGAAALDLRKVARKTGVSHAAPYRHFADKQALIAAITEEGFRRLAQRIQAILQDASDDTFEQLHAVARGYIYFAQENPWLMREMFSGLTIEHRAFPSLHQAAKVLYRLYVAIIKRGQEKGQIVAFAPDALAGVFWSLLHGTAMLMIENQMRAVTDEPDGVENAIRISVQMLYDGMHQKE
jgi:AcrR family transcriptional regulator